MCDILCLRENFAVKFQTEVLSASEPGRPMFPSLSHQENFFRGRLGSRRYWRIRFFRPLSRHIWRGDESTAPEKNIQKSPPESSHNLEKVFVQTEEVKSIESKQVMQRKKRAASRPPVMCELSTQCPSRSSCWRACRSRRRCRPDAPA